ncbi:hypothetical protein 13AC503A_gene0047 [Aeromonas phage 13AC503A]|nr:hypothetical protein 13AC503A_gene0047 [Aeromonas phage 13AC503A]
MTGFNTESLTWRAANWIHGLPDQSATTFDLMQHFSLSRPAATGLINAIRKSEQLYISTVEMLDNPTEGRRLTITAIGTPGNRSLPHGHAALAKEQQRKETAIGKTAFALMNKRKPANAS